MTAPDEQRYECTLTGCEFIGTRAECSEHMLARPGHDEFWTVPAWADLLRQRPATLAA